jgi:hypothetical protein
MDLDLKYDFDLKTKINEKIFMYRFIKFLISSPIFAHNCHYITTIKDLFSRQITQQTLLIYTILIFSVFNKPSIEYSIRTNNTKFIDNTIRLANN